MLETSLEELGDVSRLSTRKATTPKTSFPVGEGHRLVLGLETLLEMSLLAMAQAGGPSAPASVLLEGSEGFTVGAGGAVVVQDLSEFPQSGRRRRAQGETVGTLSMQKLLAAR